MLVSVTQGHIDAGWKTSCSHCPVALALKSATGLDWFVHETGAKLWFSSNPYTPLPPTAVDWIATFDAVGVNIPFEFEFDCTEEIGANDVDSAKAEG